MVIFSVLEVRLWVFGLKRIKELQNCSPFRGKSIKRVLAEGENLLKYLEKG